MFNSYEEKHNLFLRVFEETALKSHLITRVRKGKGRMDSRQDLSTIKLLQNKRQQTAQKYFSHDEQSLRWQKSEILLLRFHI